MHSSLCAVVSNMFGKGGAKQKYIESPVDLFELDEIEKEARRQKVIKDTIARLEQLAASYEE